MKKSAVNSRSISGEFKFWKNVCFGEEKDCWGWKGHYHHTGYAYYGKNGAHRIIFEKTYSIKIPKKMEICHKCDNPKCVNPFHLFLGTHDDNMKDMVAKGRSRINKIKASEGELHHKAKLKVEDVIKIRMMYDAGVAPVEICKLFPVTIPTVCKIGQRLIWKSISE